MKDYLVMIQYSDDPESAEEYLVKLTQAQYDRR